MSGVLALLIGVIVVTLLFEWVNGMHDAANAVATVVGTAVLPMRTAILLAVVLNFVGAFSGTAVAGTIGKGIVDPAAISQVLVLSALLGAILWNVLTWYFGIPSSSSHALIGGLVGSGLAKAGFSVVQFKGVGLIVLVLVTSPLVGFILGLCAMVTIIWICRGLSPGRLSTFFKKLQMASACVMAFSHGSNDAQKGMGIITMALLSYSPSLVGGTQLHVPLWVIAACAFAMALGTAAGGKRIIHTMGGKIVDLKPVHGFAAETSAACTILFASSMGLPVSTTHVISGSIMGVGASYSPGAVRWGVTIKMVWTWVLTIPACAGVAALAYFALSALLGA